MFHVEHTEFSRKNIPGQAAFAAAYRGYPRGQSPGRRRAQGQQLAQLAQLDILAPGITWRRQSRATSQVPALSPGAAAADTIQGARPAELRGLPVWV